VGPVSRCRDRLLRGFVGRTGRIASKEGDLYRVRLDEPVDVPGVGMVRDDLWEGGFLKRVRLVSTRFRR
jgi:hypothetical protein